MFIMCNFNEMYIILILIVFNINYTKIKKEGNK